MSSIEHPTLLVDGDNLLMRSIKVVEGRGIDLSTSEGVPTAPLVIFINMLARYIRQVSPERIWVCWDGGKSIYRNAIFPDYKGNRGSSGDGYRGIYENARLFLDLAAIGSIKQEGYEADDLIAHLWRHPWLSPVVILSADKDLLQLVSDDVTQIRPGDDVVWDEDRVMEKMGCRPAQWGMVLALMGDKSDNIEGVPRVGIKTACKDLAKHGWSIDSLMRAERYYPHRDLIHRNISLVDLRNSGPLGLRLPDPPEFDPDRLTGKVTLVMSDFLDKLELDDIGRRLASGTLWS